MTRNKLLCLGLLAAVMVAACGKEEAAPATPGNTQEVAPAPAPQAVGGSCSKDCAGTAVAITCAEGETPICECGPPPVASCVPPKP